MKITDYPLEERPREKAALKGVKNLTDAELLAILIQCGVRGEDALSLASELLIRSDGLYSLSRKSLPDLKLKGLGQAKKLKIIAAFELGRRAEKARMTTEVIQNSYEASYYSLDISYLPNEQVEMLCLDSTFHFIKKYIYEGQDKRKMTIDSKEVMKDALESEGIYFYFMHNHPSGVLSPSLEDMMTTQIMLSLFASIGLRLVDHLIVSSDQYYSISKKEKGKIKMLQES
jgi:DNA repair protein RadC